MSYASIVVAVVGASDDPAVVSLACDLAKRHDATATVVVAAPEMIPVFGRGGAGAGAGRMSAAVWEAVIEGRRELTERTEALVIKEAGSHGLNCQATDERPRIVIAPRASSSWLTLQRELPLADLVITGASSARGDGPWIGLFSDALIAGRAPVLIARDGAPAAGRPAAVAWDGSAEAGRALRASIPLLRDASKVAILQDPDELDVSLGSAADPERLVRYLAAQGICNASLTRLSGAKAGPALLRAAEGLDAALLVAGAFGHARLAEAIFGGATRTFLAAETGPHLFLCH
jgi:nucleotide-binding universal stress UspA family protein